MDISFLVDFQPSGGGRVYQGAHPDDGIATFQTSGRRSMLVQMANGIDAQRWVRQGTLVAVMYFGIHDAPDCCLADATLIALVKACRSWVASGPDADLIFGCAAGVSRSSYASCATLMATMRKPFDEVLGIVRMRRPQANPNSGFVEHLKRLEPVLMQL